MRSKFSSLTEFSEYYSPCLITIGAVPRKQHSGMGFAYASWFSIRSCAPAAAVFALCVAIATVALAQQAPPVLNQPYHCANGHTFTIIKCVPYRTDQWCNWQENDERGQQVINANSAWTQMAGRMAGCTVANATNPASPAPSGVTSSSGAAGASTVAAAPPAAPAKPSGPPNPAYLAPFPTADKIMALKGKDANDTVMLQLGALRQVQTMIQGLAGSRWYQHQMTPYETALLGQYSLAYDKLAKPLNYPFDGYFGSAGLLNQLSTNFGMGQAIAQWQAGNQKASSYTNSHVTPPPGAPGTSGGGGNSGGSGTASGPLRPIPPSNDPARAAIIRCLELGGADLNCVGSGMSLGLKEMGAPDPNAAIQTILGLRVIGIFNNPSSGVQLSFRDAAVTINGCKGLDIGPTVTYAVQPTAGQFAIQVNNVPKPFLAGLTSDDKMAGPPSVSVTGKVITGYRLGTEYKVDSNGVTIPGSAHQVRTPIYSDKTVTCSIGALIAGPPQLPDEGVVSAFADMLTLAAGTFSPTAQQAADKNMQQKGVPAGVRILGSYANSAGMKLQFAEGPVVVDCAQAHISVPYAIAAAGSSAAITVNNGTTKFTVVVQPDGSLSGSGSATVNGRLMAGYDADDHPAYAPTSATCSIGALALQK